MSSPRAPLPEVAWQVTGQAEVTEQGPNGTFVPGMRVSFRTGGGHAGSVFIPNSQYNLNQVRAAVAGQAALLDAVGALSSDMPAG